MQIVDSRADTEQASIGGCNADEQLHSAVELLSYHSTLCSNLHESLESCALLLPNVHVWQQADDEHHP